MSGSAWLLALRLPQNDELGPSEASADIQASDEVNAAIRRRARQAAGEISTWRGVDDTLGHLLRERLKPVFLPVVVVVDLVEQLRVFASRRRQLLCLGLNEEPRYASA